jgi:hypothetical protein
MCMSIENVMPAWNEALLNFHNGPAQLHPWACPIPFRVLAFIFHVSLHPVHHTLVQFHSEAMDVVMPSVGCGFKSKCVQHGSWISASASSPPSCPQHLCRTPTQYTGSHFACGAASSLIPTLHASSSVSFRRKTEEGLPLSIPPCLHGPAPL